ncbi:hypothetical protein [Trichothermofontia sp.]
MELHEQLKQQRVKHIINSYRLAGDDESRVRSSLEALFAVYPTPLIELALVETLAENWLCLAALRGMPFLTKTYDRLQHWEHHPIATTITPEQFQQITGLDATPVFGDWPSQPTQQPLSSS